MTFQLWHRDHPTFRDNSPATLGGFPQGFSLVAEVVTEHVGAVFQLTNHIDHDWTENPEVRVLTASRRLRSTSVGDVVTIANDRPNFRKRWSIEMVGLHAF